MSVVVVDTNVIVRFLVQTPLDQYERARKLIEMASAGETELSLSAVVVSEVAAILHHVYGRTQAEVAGALLALTTARGIQVEDEAIVLKALERSRDLKDTDFVDAYVAAKAEADGRPVATFDKALHKRLGTAVFAL